MISLPHILRIDIDFPRSPPCSELSRRAGLSESVPTILIRLDALFSGPRLSDQYRRKTGGVTSAQSLVTDHPVPSGDVQQTWWDGQENFCASQYR